ncbi:MAG: hypothetical protein LBC76_07520 [Treponema sp.]|nr:hypothetical protein [Treponema sp.]
MWYIFIMYINISFNPSAFKHGVTEDDIRWAVNTHICDVLIDEYNDKYAIIGFDKNGNLIEIIYNLIDEQSINVFHAMQCRNSFRSQLGI